MLKFHMYYAQKHFLSLLKKCEELLQCKENIVAVDFVSTVRLNKSYTKDFVKLTMLRTTEQLGRDC